MTRPRRRPRAKKTQPIEIAISATCRLTFSSEGYVASVRLKPLETVLRSAHFQTKAQLLKDLNLALSEWIRREVEANVQLAEQRQEAK
jgi:hypothetical protein